MAALLVQCSFLTRTLTMGVLNGHLTRPVFFSNAYTDDGGFEWPPYSSSVLFQRVH